MRIGSSVAVGAMACGLVALMCLGCGTGADESAAVEPAAVEVALATVERGDVRETVALDGTFAPVEGSVAKLAPTTAGRLAAVFVKEGDAVRAGQLLARIDTSVQAEEARSAQGAAAAAQEMAASSALALRAAGAQQEAAQQTARLALAAAEAERDAEVEQASLELRKLRAGARPQEIAQAEQAVVQAEVQRDRAAADAERDRQLLADGYVSRQQAEASQAALATAQSAYKQAQEQLNLLRAGAREEDIRVAEARLEAARTVGAKRVEQAQAVVRQADAGALAVQAQAREAAASRFGASEKQAGASAARAQELNGDLRAPFAGRVTRAYLAAGDQADPSTPVLEVAAEGAHTDFVASATPAEAGALAAGMPVVFPALGALKGTVVSIGEPERESGMVPVRARCSGSAEPAGTFASAHIVVATHADAVRVPRECVLTREGASVVFVVKDGEAHRTSIRTGSEDAGWVEVLQGLSAGDVVVRIGQHELADGAKVVAQRSAESGP